MKVVLENHILLRDSIQAISELIDEGIFKFGPSGMEFVSADRAVIAVVAFFMNKERFKEYDADDEEIGLNLIDMLKVLKRGKASEQLSIEKEGSSIKFTFTGRATRSFKLPVLRIPESEKPPIDRITEFKAELSIEPELLENAVEDGSLISDSIIFLVEPEKLTMRAEGPTKEMETAVENGNGVDIKAEEPVRARYSLEYLKKIMKGSKVGGDCKMFMASNYPLKIVFSDSGIRLGYILAPRVED